jgi:hypothetical protein
LVLLIFVQEVQGTCFRFSSAVLRDFFPDPSQVDEKAVLKGNKRCFPILNPTDLIYSVHEIGYCSSRSVVKYPTR